MSQQCQNAGTEKDRRNVVSAQEYSDGDETRSTHCASTVSHNALLTVQDPTVSRGTSTRERERSVQEKWKERLAQAVLSKTRAVGRKAHRVRRKPQTKDLTKEEKGNRKRKRKRSRPKPRTSFESPRVRERSAVKGLTFFTS